MAITLIPRDVRTRWNSTYDMLCFILEHKKAYRRFTADDSNDLQDYELKADKWEVVEQLCKILAVRSTECLCNQPLTMHTGRSSKMLPSSFHVQCPLPNVVNVIPIMDIINDTLTTAANDQNIAPAIRTAAGLTKKTLNRYYSRTDESETYRIAMSMSFSFILPLLLTDLPKSFIPSVNCSILRPQNGRRIGLTLLRQFSIHNMNSTTSGTQTQANVETIRNQYEAICSYALHVNKLHSRHQFERNQLRNQICLTLFSNLQSLLVISVRKLTDTSPLILRPLTMFSYGGGNDMRCIHACPGWHWIT